MNKYYVALVVFLGVVFFGFNNIHAHALVDAHNHTDSQYLVDRITGLDSEIKNRGGVQVRRVSSGVSDEVIQVEKAVERKELMKELMRVDPVLFESVVMDAPDRETLPESVQSHVEYIDTISGKLTVVYGVEIENGVPVHSHQYYVDTPEQQYEFYPITDLTLLSGTVIELTGHVLDAQISGNSTTHPVVVLGAPPVLTSTGVQRALVLLVKAQPGDSEPFTPAEGQDLVFNGQFQDYMQEQSYGAISYTGDVFGWVSINRSITSNCFFLTQSELQGAVNGYNINLANYDTVVYLLPSNGGGCATVGESAVTVNNTSYPVAITSIGLGLGTSFAYNSPSGFGQQPFTWTNLDYLLGHELGHTLGLVHANRWSCSGGQMIRGNCTNQEYGNHFDVMGTNSYALNYNAFYKERLGWIPENKMLSITTSGSYTINPLQTFGGNALGAKINFFNPLTNATESFYIEYRKALGFDLNLNTSTGPHSPDVTSNQTGIFINHAVGSTSYLLDLSPQTDASKVTLNLPAYGTSVSSVTDSVSGITIGPVLAVSASAVTFNVTFPIPVLSYSGEFYESVINDGSVTGSRVITLTDDTFVNAGSVLQENTHYTVANVPVGLTPTLTISNNGQSATLTLTGNAVSSTLEDSVSDLTITFLNGAFTNTPTASTVVNYTDTTGSIYFNTYKMLWKFVGTPGFSTGGASYMSLALDSTNTPYALYRDGAQSNKATLMKFDGTSWVAVGTPGFSTGTAEHTSLALDSTNTPYALYRDGAQTNKMTGMKFEPLFVPTLTTDSLPTITDTSAVLTGTIVSTGGEPSDVVGFNYGLDTTYGTNVTQNGTFDVGSFTLSISDLTCRTTYHYRSYAINNRGTGYGDDQNFTTNGCPSRGGGGGGGNIKPPIILPNVPGTGAGVGDVTTPIKYIFTRTLQVGSSGNDVLELQKFLNTQGFTISLSGPGSAGNETTYFGRLTQTALARYQEAHALQILTPLRLTKGTGIFGPSTRTFVNTR